MKRMMLVVVVLLGVSSSSLLAQDRLTLAEVETLFFERSPLVKARRADLAVFDGRISAARRRANPTLNVSGESLENGSRESETGVSLAQEFDLTGLRHLRVRSLEHQRKAQTYRLSHELRAELTQIKKTFCRVVILRRDVDALSKVLQALEAFEEANRTRLREGDIAEVDLMRLEAERQKVRRLIDALESEAHLEKRGLAFSLGLASCPPLLDPDLPGGGGVFRRASLDREALLAMARENRADLQAFREGMRGAEASIAAARREVHAPVTIEGGYKSQSGGFQGFTIGVSLPLPWSHRNQDRIRELTAEREAERLRASAMEQELAGRIEIAFERLAFLKERAAQLDRQREQAGKILQIAAFSYGEGEGSLLEVLDAMRSESEIVLDRNRTTFDTWSVMLDLEALTGFDPPDEGDTR